MPASGPGGEEGEWGIPACNEADPSVNSTLDTRF